MPGLQSSRKWTAAPRGSQTNGVGVLIQGYNVMREEQELKAEAKRRLDLEAKTRYQVRAREGSPGDWASTTWRSLSKVHA